MSEKINNSDNEKKFETAEVRDGKDSLNNKETRVVVTRKLEPVNLTISNQQFERKRAQPFKLCRQSYNIQKNFKGVPNKK